MRYYVIVNVDKCGVWIYELRDGTYDGIRIDSQWNNSIIAWDRDRDLMRSFIFIDGFKVRFWLAGRPAGWMAMGLGGRIRSYGFENGIWKWDMGMGILLLF